MPTTRFTVHTSLTPDAVVALLTDFGPERSEHWPNNDDSHYQLHDSGPGWAEVTEGNRMGWERERYEWDAGAGTVDVETLDSNIWAPGSGWHYRAHAAATGGSDVSVTLVRHGRGFVGHLVGAGIPLAGPLLLSRQLRSVLRRGEQQPG